jgi:hypothetical protein
VHTPKNRTGSSKGDREIIEIRTHGRTEAIPTPIVEAAASRGGGLLHFLFHPLHRKEVMQPESIPPDRIEKQ